MKSGFRQVHPLISFIYFIIVIFFGMLFKNAVYLLTLLTITTLLLLFLDGAKTLLPNLRFYLFMALFIIILNPLFSTTGSTVLFYIKYRSITLEGVIYGFVFALSLLNILFAFTAYNIIISSQKFLYLFGNVLPKVTFILSIMMRFIPLFRRRMTDIMDVQKTLKPSRLKKNYQKRMTDSMTTFNTLVSWTLEESLENASSMRARGYGNGKRTSATFYSFDLRDKVLTILFFFTFLVTMIGYFYGFGKTTFHLFHYLIFIILAAAPLFIEMREYLRWHFMKYNT